MKLLWKLFKTSVLISFLLLLGQVPIGRRTVGGHLVHQLYLAVVWAEYSLRDAEWFKKMSEQKKDEGSSPGEKVAFAKIPESPKVESEKITSTDRESLRKLLDE